MTLLPDPPADTRIPDPFAETLKHNPGLWAEYRAYRKRNTANVTAYHIRRHQVSWADPTVRYATATRRKPDGTYAVWVTVVEGTDDGHVEQA